MTASSREGSPAKPVRSDGHSSAARPANPSPSPASRAGHRLSTRQKHFNQRHVQRNHRQYKRSQAAGQCLLRIHQSHIAAAEKQQSHYPEQKHGSWRETQCGIRASAPCKQNGPGNQKARTGQQQRGHFRRADADRRIGRSPEEVHAGKCQHNGQPVSPVCSAECSDSAGTMAIFGFHRSVRTGSFGFSQIRAVSARSARNGPEKPMESRFKRVLSSTSGAPMHKHFSSAMQPYQPQNAGRGRARGASALDATCACCPPAPDLASSAATSTGPPKPSPLSQMLQVCETEMTPQPGSAALPLSRSRANESDEETRDE